MRYFRPKSVAWWAGVFLIAMGVVQAAGWGDAWVDGAAGSVFGVLDALASAVSSMAGGGDVETPPSVQIGLGLGLIGLRDAQFRDSERAALEAEERQEEILNAMGSQATTDAAFEDVEFPAGWDDAFDDEGEPDFSQPDGESPLPPGVRDPYADGGSRS